MSPDRGTGNDRPRDALGRPLPPGDDGVAPIPDVSRAPHDALALAQSLIDEGRAFAAHEVLERAWKDTSGPRRDFWRALAQVAVGLTHAQRGNATGARALLTRAHEGLAAYEGTTPYDVDVDDVRAHVHDLIDTIERNGLPTDFGMRLAP